MKNDLDPKRGSESRGNYRRYVELLLQLNDLGVRGKADSVEADEVRDRMDAPWHRLTEQEIKQVESISADLNVLEEWIRRPGAPGKVSLQDMYRTLHAFHGESNPNRPWNSFSSEDYAGETLSVRMACLLKGMLYLDLDEGDVADRFHQGCFEPPCRR